MNGEPRIDQELVDAVTEFAARRFPTGEATAAAVKRHTGNVLTSVHVETPVDTAFLCAETGAICEAHKLDERVVATICVHRESPAHPFLIVPPCGICQERLLFWGADMAVAVPGAKAGQVWAGATLRDLHPYDWAEVFKPT